MERRFLNKSFFQSFLILVSSVVSPCAVLEYTTPFFRHRRVWIFPFGAYIQEIGIGDYPISSQFRLLISQGNLILFSIMIIVTSVVFGLILATKVITLQENSDLVKKIYVSSILLLVIIIQIALAIEMMRIFGIVGSLLWIHYIIPLPIPLLITILLLKHKGFRFMRESYFQGFLVLVSSSILPFAVVSFEIHYQEWFFSFGIIYLIINEHLRWTLYFMPLFLENWFPYFIILGIGWMAIGLALAVVVVKSWERKEFERKDFFISIILFILQILGPIAVVFLVYNWNLVYVIPLPIPFLIAILLLKRRGVALMPVRTPSISVL